MNLPRVILLVVFVVTSLSVNAQTAHIDSLLQVVAQNKRDTSQIKALNDLSVEFSRKDVAKEKQFIYQGITLAKQLSSSSLYGFYALLTTAHHSLGSIDSANYYLSVLETASKKNPNDQKIAMNYHHTAGVLYRTSGRPKEALPHMLQTLDMAKDSTTRAGMLLNIGNIYSDLSDIQSGTSYHLKSLALFEKVGNKKGQSFVLTSLGNDFLRMKQYTKALPYFQKSLAIKEELKDKRGILTALSGLGNVSMELNDYPAAITFFEKENALAKETNFVKEQGESLHLLGQVYHKMGESLKSKEYLEQALKIAQQMDEKAWVSWIESTILKVNDEVKAKGAAKALEASLLKSLAQYEESGDKIGQANAHLNLSEFYAQHTDFGKAFSNLRTARMIEDSTRGQRVEAQLLKLEQQYASEKKDREIELLRKDQALKTAELERRQVIQAGVIVVLISVLIIGILLVNRSQVIAKSKRLAEIEKMRNTIARDLHDDIGSTLSSINILSQLAMRNGSETDSKNFSKIAEQSGRMMENMSDIVWSISPGNDSLEQVVSKMKEFAAEILEPKNISYRFTDENSLKDTTLSLEKRKNLFLIFKEAVNNAAKYSGATDLQIAFVRQGNTLSLSVIDNGGGFEPDLVKAGNGLKNMKERAKALSARFDFASKKSEGTRIALELPIT